MKKWKSLAAFTLIAATLLSIACQKQVEQPTINTITKEKLAGTYKVTAMMLKSNTGAEANLFSSITDCQKQDRQILNANLSYQIIDACNPADSQTGTWTLVNAQTIIINGVSGRLISFDGQKLVLAFDNFFGMPGTMTETLTKQ